MDPDKQEVGSRFGAIVSDLLLRPDLPRQPDPAAAARDVAAMMKGMVDAAGVHGEADQQALADRVRRAVFGYLGARPETPAVHLSPPACAGQRMLNPCQGGTVFGSLGATIQR